MSNFFNRMVNGKGASTATSLAAEAPLPSVQDNDDNVSVASSTMSIELKKPRRTRDIGTYRQVPKVNWNTLNETNFTSEMGKLEVDWLKLYPVKKSPRVEDEFPIACGPMSPRQACKLFYDACYLIEQSEKNIKFLQDKLPEMCHKAFKRKQWQKQLLEGSRRVACRIAKGLMFNPNCVAEDVFVLIILHSTFNLGWRRIDKHLEGLPETATDRDFSKIARSLSNGEVELLWRGADAVTSAAAKSKDKKQSNGTILDCRTWFNGYADDAEHLLDHHIEVSV